MRDLNRYPITLDEAIRAVERAAEDYRAMVNKLPPERRPMGDIQGAALAEARARLVRLQFAAA